MLGIDFTPFDSFIFWQQLKIGPENIFMCTLVCIRYAIMSFHFQEIFLKMAYCQNFRKDLFSINLKLSSYIFY